MTTNISFHSSQKQVANNRRSSGFTIVELMVVTAIIGILSTLSISGYQQYTQNAQITELRVKANALKKQVELCVNMGRRGNDCQSGGTGQFAPPTAITATDSIIGEEVAFTAAAGSGEDATPARYTINITAATLSRLRTSVGADVTFLLTGEMDVNNGNFIWKSNCTPVQIAELCQ